MQTN
jgi:hypothetical protein